MTTDPADGSILVSGVWLRLSGKNVIVAVEIDGTWRDVITERADGCYSHIVEPNGIRKAPPTPL